MPGGRFAYDVDNLLEKQKIVFIMPVSSYSEPYVEGYFIDTKGKKHIYGLYGQAPFESIEKEYLYHVNIDSERKTEGTSSVQRSLSSSLSEFRYCARRAIFLGNR